MAKEKVIFNEQLHGETLVNYIKQCSDHKVIVESASEAIAEIRKMAKDELGVDSKHFNKLLNMYHKDQRDAFEEESEEVIGIYDTIFAK